ncbi:MAG: DUF348 domain-containing protein [Firmicutes bacterium]|nr:DUF348 domain-containing protein [Bacillota bacterium]
MSMAPALGPDKARSKRSTQLILAVAILLSLAAVGYVGVHKELTLVVGEETRTVGTLRGTVKDLLAQEGVELQEGDLIEPGLSTKLVDYMTVTVRRAVPVKVVTAGSSFDARTARDTVGEALQELGIEVGPLDRVVPGLGVEIQPGQEITLVRVIEEMETRQVVVPFTTQRRDDNDLPRGETRIVRAGQDGLKEQQVRLIREDGKLVKEEIVAENVIKEPVTELVAVGTVGVLSRGGRDYRFTKALDMVATAYCPTDTGGSFTALGLPTRRGIVAVAPRVIPLGTKLYVDGYGIALAGDTGSAIKGNRIDLFLDTHKEAVEFGRRRVKVYVLKE